MKYPWCEKCGRHGVCRMESDMAVVLRKLAEVAIPWKGAGLALKRLALSIMSGGNCNETKRDFR